MAVLSLTFIFYTCIFTFLFFLIIRRRNQSPSERLPPGPKPWPIVGNLPHLGSLPHQTMAKLARIYGPLVYLRLGYVDVVVASSAEVAMRCLKLNDVNFACRPPSSGAKHMAYDYHDLVFAPYGHRWRLLRKVSMIHLFSSKALKDFSHVREEEVACLMRTILSAGEKAVEISSLLNVCSTNALGRSILGKRVFGKGDEKKADEFKKNVVDVMTLAGVFNIGDFIPALEWLDLQGVRARMKKVHDKFDVFLTEVLENYRAEMREDDKNFLSTLLSLDDDEGGKLTDTEIKALLLNMFTAGTDTSSSAIEWGLAELIRHPKILAQAQEEMDAVVGRDRLVLESDLPKLTYLQAVIKENFRLHPSTPLSLPRISSKSCEVNGHVIPEGSTLLVNIWAIARDPDAWDEPLEFRPERFLEGGERPNLDVKGTDFDLIPFGAGRRICVGMNLGLRNVQIYIATLVQAFDWALPRGLSLEKLNMDEAFGLALQRAEPLLVHPRPRLLPHVYHSRGYDGNFEVD